MPLSAGQTFAGYRIIRRLGSGGMGEVYLAQHPRLPRRDALKLLGTDVSADSNAVLATLRLRAGHVPNGSYLAYHREHFAEQVADEALM